MAESAAEYPRQRDQCLSQLVDIYLRPNQWPGRDHPIRRLGRITGAALCAAVLAPPWFDFQIFRWCGFVLRGCLALIAIIRYCVIARISQDWLNRIGLSLQFIALFLVAPEIFGEQRVTRLTEVFWLKPVAFIRRTFNRTLNSTWLNTLWLIAFAVFVVALLLSLFRISVDGWTLFHRAKSTSLDSWSSWTRDWSNVAQGSLWGLLTGAGLGVIGLIGGWLLKVLTGSSRSYLPLGATLFTIGFGVLMWGTFIPADH